MSAVDLCQLFMHRLQNEDAFGIVLSPRKQGIKALCVHLTNQGFLKLKNYYEIAKHNFFEYACARIKDGTDAYYCQIPFQVSADPTIVCDMRSPEEVIGQLASFIPSASPDT